MRHRGRTTSPRATAGRRRSRIAPFLLAASLVSWGAFASAQDPLPTVPALPAGSTAEGSDELSPTKLLERLRRMEQVVGELRGENQDLKEKYQKLSQEFAASRGQPSQRTGYIEGWTPDAVDGPGAADTDDRGRGRVTQGEGGFTREFDEQEAGNRVLGKLPLGVHYNYGREGIELATDDAELLLKLRFLLQADARFFLPSVESPVTSGFYLPRARLYFDGHVTKPIEYQISFQQAYDSFNLLNAFLNFNYDKRLQLRFGRFKTPYTYEFYKINVWDLFAPERSIYNVNFALNRQLGATASGELFDERMEYSVGAFNGQRNSYQPFKNTPDVIGLLNFQPFGTVSSESWLSALRNLNVGGSAAYGNEDNPLNPAVLRTSANASSAPLDSSAAFNSANVPFLAFNDNVRERGVRALWEMHLAYFYQGLSLLGAWDSGYESWAIGTSGPRPVRVPVNGYFVQAAYLVTGETRTETGLIDPIHPFDLRLGRFGLGAFEPTARFSELTVGQQVFTAGFADPNLWSNKAYMVDVGFNWYLNKFVKIYFDWEHAIFGQPVYYSPEHFSKTNDTFWAQLSVLLLSLDRRPSRTKTRGTLRFQNAAL